MAATVFLASEAAIMDGRFTGDLLAATPVAGALDEIAGFTRSRIFETRERFQTEVMGGEVLTSLLDAFCDAHLALERAGSQADVAPRQRALLPLLPQAPAPGAPRSDRSEGRRGGKEWVSPCRSRGAP